MSKIIKIVIGLAIVGLVLYFGSGYLSRQSPAGSVTITASAENSGGSEVLSVLNALNSVAFDVGFFGDKIFQSLADFSVVLTPREAGRNNPFAPVSAGVSSLFSSQTPSNSPASNPPASAPRSGR